MSGYIRQSVQAMHGYTPGEQPGDGVFIKLNTNENPYPPSPAVARAIAELDPASLRKYPDPVSSELRSLIADLHNCKPAQVIAANGSDELLALCTRAFVENDGSIGWFNPSYSLYPILADIRNVRHRPVDLMKDYSWPSVEGKADTTLGNLDASLFFLTMPNAPTGTMYPLPIIKEFCARFQGVVVIDEAYADFASSNCMALANEFNNVIITRSMSKSFSLAGLRFGYAIGPVELIDAMYRIKDSYNIGTLVQAAAKAAIQDIDWMHANVERIKKTRTRLTGELQELGYRVIPSETNFIWTSPTGKKAEDLFETLYKERILVRYFPGELTGAWIRISIGTDEEIDRLMEVIRNSNSTMEADNESA